MWVAVSQPKFLRTTLRWREEGEGFARFIGNAWACRRDVGVPGSGTLGTLGRAFTILPFAGFGVPGGEAFLDFFGGDVFDVGADGPAEAEGVEDHGAAFALGVGGAGAEDFGCGGGGLCGEGIAVWDVEVEAEWAAADGLWAVCAPVR